VKRRGCPGAWPPATIPGFAVEGVAIATGLVGASHTGAKLLTDKQIDRLTALFADDRHIEIEATWGVYQRMIAAYRDEDRVRGRDLMTKLIGSISRGVPKTPDGHLLGPHPEEARRRRACLLRPAQHRNGPTGDQRPTRAPARLRTRVPQPDNNIARSSQDAHPHAHLRKDGSAPPLLDFSPVTVGEPWQVTLDQVDSYTGYISTVRLTTPVTSVTRPSPGNCPGCRCHRGGRRARLPGSGPSDETNTHDLDTQGAQ
jgi:hypothetical protein